MSELARLEVKHIVQSTHCAVRMKIVPDGSATRYESVPNHRKWSLEHEPPSKRKKKVQEEDSY